MTSDRIPLWHPLVLVPLALSAWVYYPITGVFFYADDLIHLLSIANNGPLAFVLEPFGGHAYLARNLIFLATYEVFGLRSEGYYWTVLLTHLLNVSLLFAMLHTLTRSAALACFGAALWGTLPLHVAVIGWYSVYGHALVATALLAVLVPLTRLAAVGAPPTARTAALWYALMLLGVVLFGTGIGVALAFPAVLFLFLPSTWRRPGLRAAYLALPPITLAFYYAARRLYLLVAPLPASELLHEAFARMGFRVMLPMFGHLLGFSMASVVFGFLRPPYPSLACWAAIAAFCAGLGLVAWRGDGPTRRAALAMAVLAVTVYFVIALGRSVEYTAFGVPAAVAAQYVRYHYVATIPVVALLCLILQQASGLRGGPSVVTRGLALFAGLGLIVAGRLYSGFAIDVHPQARSYFAETLGDIETAVAAQPAGSTVYLENLQSPVTIFGPVIKNPAFPGRAAVFLIAHPSDTVDGRRVRFVERDRQIRTYYAQAGERRLGELLVAPEDVPKRP